MALNFIEKNDWLYIPAPGRLDAFNFDQTKQFIEEVRPRTKQIAFDVREAHFVSLPMIKYLHGLALELSRAGGRLALVGTTEKLKRQISIYASTDPFVFMTNDSWQKLVNTNIEGQA